MNQKGQPHQTKHLDNSSSIGPATTGSHGAPLPPHQQRLRDPGLPPVSCDQAPNTRGNIGEGHAGTAPPPPAAVLALLPAPQSEENYQREEGSALTR